MDLETKKAFAGVVLWVFIDKINTFFTLEPGLDVIVFTADLDGIPRVPFKEFGALSCEFCAVLLIAFLREKPFTASFIKKSGSPGAVAIVAFALLAVNTAVTILRRFL